MMSTHTDFLVRVKSYTDITMFYFVVISQVTHCLHNFCNTCFVISTKKGSTISHDEVLTDVLFKFREFCSRRNDTWRKLDVISVIVFHDTCLDVLTATIRASVIMRDKTYCRNIFLGVCFKCGVDVPHLVHLYIREFLVL